MVARRDQSRRGRALGEGADIWVAERDGSGAEPVATGGEFTFPAWTPRGELACLAADGEGRQTLQLPCAQAAESTRYADREAYGGLAFSPDGSWVLLGSPGDGGFLDLWAVSVADGQWRQLSSFTRDAYDPSVAPDGSVYFKSQDYRVFLATAPAGGGPPVR